MQKRAGWKWLTGILILAGLALLVSLRRNSLDLPLEHAVAASSRLPEQPAVTATATKPATNPRLGSGACEWLASAWKTDAHPAFAAFRDWAERYLAAAPADRAGLLAEGIELARQRREVLAKLIRTDPRAALSAAVPMVVRQQLPAEIVDLLEQRVSARGVLALNAVTPLPGQAVAEPLFRSALIDGEEYRAYVYGRRETQSTVSATSILGIAVDHALAVSESPLRVLEPGETAADRPLDPICAISGNFTPVTPATPLNTAGEATAVEYNGKVQVLCHIAHVSALEQQLLASEVDHIQTEADNQPGTSGVSGRPSSSWTHGTKKMLVIRVDFSDLPGTPVNTYVDGQPITPDTIANVINGTNGVNTFYINCSYGQSAIQLTPTTAGVSPDVTPVLRMPSTAASYATANNNSQLHTDAENAATTAGYNVAGYDRVGVVFTSLASISGSQINYGGLGEVIGRDFWVNGEFDLRVVAHEVGHNYGLNHANLWQVSDGNPVSPNGSSTEYGDPNDVMGSGSTYQHEFTHWNKSILQWIPDSSVTLASAAGTYRIYRFDGGTATNLANPRALKIVRNATQDYWIGYRRGDGNASLMNGAYIIWGYNSNQQGNLLDMTTPGTNVNDAGLAIGTTFNDTVAGISITPVAQGGSGSEEYLDVQVGFQTKVQFSSASYTIDQQQGSVTLTVSRSLNSVGAVSVNYATADGTATSPANYTVQSGTLNWADGDAADKTITIPINTAAAVAGTVNFTVALSGATGAVLGGNATAAVSVAGPGARDAGFNPDYVDNEVQKVLPLPDGSMILGGWFETVYDTGYYNSYPRGGITRLLAAGTLDPAFASGGGAAGGNLNGFGNTVVFDLARQPDGKIIVAGEFATFNGTARSRIVRLNADGTVDPAFNPGTGADNTIYAVLVQPDGKIVIGGAFANYNGSAAKYLARLNSDGSRDTGFTGPAFASSGWRVESLAMQADGKILAGGTFYFSGSPFKAGICRVLSTGALDATFNGVTNGAHYSSSTSSLANVYKIVVQPDGKILIAGDFSAYNGTANLFGGLARLTSTGAIDSSFTPPTASSYAGGSFPGSCTALLLQPDGRIVVGGTFTTFGSAANYVARFSSTGAFDSAFAAAGGFGNGVNDLELLPNGRVLLGGNFGNFQNASVSGPIWQFFPGLSGLPGTVQFSSTTYSGSEGTTLTLSVTRTGGSLGALTVGYATLPGTATTADYTPAAGTLTWADGDAATKTISVPLTTDLLVEGTETFTVNLGQPLVGSILLGATQQATAQIIDVPPSAFVLWQQAKFTAGELLDPTVSGPNAVYGQDGLPNLVKYALGLEPKQNITTGLPVAGTSGSNWTYTYTRPTSMTDVTYTVEYSTDLAIWTPLGAGTQLSSVAGTDTWQATYPLASASSVFFRLQVIH